MAALFPSYFNLLRECDEKFEGTVSNRDELKELLEVFERTYMAAFVEWSQRKKGQEQRLQWNSDINPDFDFPSTVASRSIKRCSFGGSPRMKTDAKNCETDHEYVRRKPTSKQASRKIGCAAKVQIRALTIYEDYKTPRSSTRSTRKKLLDQLKDDVKAGIAQATTRILVSLPKPAVHNHTVSNESGFTHRIHPAVRDKIYDLVGLGYTTVPVIRELLKDFVLKDICASTAFKPQPHDQAYFPKAGVICRHIHGALAAGKSKDFDRDNQEHRLEGQQEEDSHATASSEEQSQSLFRSCLNELQDLSYQCTDSNLLLRQAEVLKEMTHTLRNSLPSE